jgi:hypothetical protein
MTKLFSLAALLSFGLGIAADRFVLTEHQLPSAAQLGWDVCMAMHVAYQDAVAELSPSIAVAAAKRENLQAAYKSLSSAR